MGLAFWLLATPAQQSARKARRSRPPRLQHLHACGEENIPSQRRQIELIGIQYALDMPLQRWR